MKILAILGLIARLLAPSPTFAATPTDLSEALDQAVCCGHESYSQALEIFDRMKQTGSPSPQDFYFAGYASMALHRFDSAAPLLKAAKNGEFNGPQGWPSADEMLARVKTIAALAPPLMNVKGAALISVYANSPDQWSGPIIEATPMFSRIGQEIFASRLPAVNLYLFTDRATYERFYAAVFAVPIPTAWQDATGNIGIVVACGQSHGGKITRPPGIPETTSDVFHEFGHAWMNSYLMARYNENWIGERRIPLLDEGISDYVASLRDQDFMERRKKWIAEKVNKGATPPAFKELLDYHDFYEQGDVDLHYWLSALLVQNVLSPRGASDIPRILDVWAGGANAESAVRKVTKKDLRGEYVSLVKLFWQKT